MDDDQAQPGFSEAPPDWEHATRVVTRLCGVIQDHAHTFYAQAHIAAAEGEPDLAEFLHNQAERADRLLARIYDITRG